MVQQPISLVVHMGVTSGSELVEHFLDHYFRLGVDRFLVILHCPPGEAARRSRVLAVLRSRDIRPVMEVDEYSYVSRQVRINQVLDAHVADDEWIIHADLDEFHEYPAELPRFLAACDGSGYTFARGRLIDRVAVDGELRAIQTRALIWQQFPLSVDLTSKIGGGWDLKVCCAKGFHRSGDGGTHSVDYGTSRVENYRLCQLDRRCHPSLLRVFHFKWDRTLMTRLGRRIAAYQQLSLGVSRESERLLRYIEANHSRISLDSATADDAEPHYIR